MAIRIIPCLDVINGRVVKGKKFSNIKDVDDPVKLGKYYSDSGADVWFFMISPHQSKAGKQP